MPYTQDPQTVVKITERLWSDEVGRADPVDVLNTHDAAYQFSNGARFLNKNPYPVVPSPPAPAPPPPPIPEN